ncbi:hypothetical protein AGMMS49949_08520 [Alphaproteobacteria bacterium]|nr:hypothetical protein AGMMS49949_08520 [Alphaproteobacteria bacterium]GHS99551.1 hypothetical protein AGMMS50296_7740 [Alphaproteobacteria bacterium]
MIDFLEALKTSPHLAYLIVFGGSLIEGETVILTASALAAAHYLSLRNIWLIAFLTTLCLDQGLYFYGHFLWKHPNKPISERFPRLYRKSRRAVILLKRYDIWFILSFRFVYGIRALSPVVIGLCGILPRRFIPLNAISAFLWATISCSIGYWLGDTFVGAKNAETSVMHYVQIGILSLVGLALALILLRKGWKKRKNVAKA